MASYQPLAAPGEQRAISKWRRRLSSLHPSHLSIARGFAWTLLFVVVGRLAGAGREMAIAAHYGASETVDAYLFVFNLVSWPFAVWFNVLNVVLVPTIIRLRRGSEGAQALRGFRSGLLGVSLLVGCAVGIILWLALSSASLLSATGLPPSTVQLAGRAASWLAPIVPLGFVAAFYSAWLMGTGRYVNTLIEAVPALTVLLVVLAFPSGGVAPLLGGTLLGFTLQVTTFAAVLGGIGELASPRLATQKAEWRQFWSNFFVMVVGQGLMTASAIVDQVMAAPLAPGTIATLGYANRIIALMLGLGALSVSRATLPIFSGMRAAADPRLPRIAIQWAAVLFCGGAVAALLAWVLAPAAVALLFQRGAFTTENTQAVVNVFSFGLVQIPFYCGGLVFTALLAACGRYPVTTTIGAAGFVFKPIMNWLLIPYFGAAGIVLATGFMYALSFAVMMVFVISSTRRSTL